MIPEIETYNKFLTCDTLRPGDVARFISIDAAEVRTGDRKIYQGIVIEVARPSSDGEITYTVLCDDSIVRFFCDYETIEEVSLIGSSGISVK
jgi:hypothetical protein